MGRGTGRLCPGKQVRIVLYDAAGTLYCVVLCCTVQQCTVLCCTAKDAVVDPRGGDDLLVKCMLSRSMGRGPGRLCPGKQVRGEGALVTEQYSTVLYCTVQYCSVSRTVLDSTVRYSIVQYCTVLGCTVLCCTALSCAGMICAFCCACSEAARVAARAGGCGLGQPPATGSEARHLHAGGGGPHHRACTSPWGTGTHSDTTLKYSTVLYWSVLCCTVPWETGTVHPGATDCMYWGTGAVHQGGTQALLFRGQ